MTDVRVILGPPGTGKTTRLIREVTALLEGGAAPYEIAFVSFTNAACDEARDRACDQLHLDPEDLPHFRTIHSMAMRTLGREKPTVMAAKHWKAFAELAACDFSDSTEDPDNGVFRVVLQSEGDAMLAVWDRSRVSLCSVDEAMLAMRRQLARVNLSPQEIRRFGEQFTRYKQTNGLIDFTDMLDLSLRGRGRPGGVRFAFVDEAQDLNPMQHALCRQWFCDAERLTYAGDDDQAIYTFAGARPDLLQSLAKANATEILDQSYRVPALVHALAMQIAGRIHHRTQKPYRPREEPGEILYARDAGEALSQITGTAFVLSRNKQFLGKYAAAAESRATLYEVARGCGSLAPTQHKDTIGAFRALAALLENHAAGAEHFHCLVGAIPSLDANKVKLRLRGSVKRAAANHDAVYPSMARTFFEPEWWDALLASSKPFDALSTLEVDESQYLQRLFDRFGSALPAEPEVRMLTQHRSKGREADTVIICPDMAWPSYDELQDGDADSEHRLAYVAATRARKRLVIVSPWQPTPPKRALFYPFPSARRT
jgi:superfamily I DNA/RNA helicase